MNKEIFHRVYNHTLSKIDTNPDLKKNIAHELFNKKKMRSTFKSVLFLAPTLAAAAFATIVLLPKISRPVTAEQLIAKALAVPSVAEGQIYSRTVESQISERNTVTNAETITTTYIQTMSDGDNLQKLYFDADHTLTGASLYLANSDGTYTAYDYGNARQYAQERPLYAIDGRHVLNASSDAVDPTNHFTVLDTNEGLADTNSNADPDWVEPLGKESILEMVSGASIFRQYLQSNSDTSTVFDVAPNISETTVNGIAAYVLDFSTPTSTMVAWLSKTDGHVLQEQFGTESSNLPTACSQADSNYVAKSTSVYSEATLTAGDMPDTLDEFVAQLSLTAPAEVTLISAQKAVESDMIINDGNGEELDCNPV